MSKSLACKIDSEGFTCTCKLTCALGGICEGEFERGICEGEFVKAGELRNLKRGILYEV